MLVTLFILLSITFRLSKHVILIATAIKSYKPSSKPKELLVKYLTKSLK
jgi:hypothetical protein